MLKSAGAWLATCPLDGEHQPYVVPAPATALFLL